MKTYFEVVNEKFKDWKTAVPVVIFTILRIIYGWAWVTAGIEKLPWFTNGKLNSAGLIGKLVVNIAGPKVTKFDPLYINKLWSWIAQTFFLGMPRLTDYLVVVVEISVGVLMILGFRIFWVALLAMFMNVQFITSGSFNNFGYIWTNLVFLKVAKYAELLGLSGYLKYRKGMKASANTRANPQIAK